MSNLETERKKQDIINNIIYHDMVGLYCRVSTDIQVREGFSLEEQEERLRALCTYKTYEVVDIYVDAGISGKDTNRPEFQRMMEDIKNGRINRIITLKLDRLTRSIIDLENLVRFLEENNCSLKETNYFAVINYKAKDTEATKTILFGVDKYDSINSRFVAEVSKRINTEKLDIEL